MPARTRKRKPKRRKPSSRKKARRRRPRPRPASPRLNTPSSDEDFVLDGDDDESSSGSTEEEDDEQEEDTEEEEESEDDSRIEVRNFDANVGLSGRTHRHPTRAGNGLVNASHQRRKEDSSDEDVNADIDRNGFARDSSAANRQSAPSRPRRQHRRVNELDEDSDKDAQRSMEDNPPTHASRSRRWPSSQNPSDEDFDIESERVLEDTGTGGVRRRHHRVRRRHRRQDSSDEDFEMDMERVLESSFIANEGAVASRPMTRAMDSGHVSNLHEGGPGNSLSDSFKHEARGFSENSYALQQVTVRGLGAGEPSQQEAHANFVRRGGSVVNDTEVDKRKGKEKALQGEESTTSFSASDTLLPNTKASNAEEETAAVVCGICWTEMVVVERGKLDSCDHFFCFGCIMEWAKVESRCPMCKQRFTTISKSGTGISKRTRTVRVPLRDQVYIPPEDPDLPLEDPYADIVCMECRGTGDEGLLLLCDHCDSAAHTFCVGLGRSVPLGDWYCRECQALIGGISGSGDEAEELVLASGDDDDEEEEADDDTEDLLRSIVASVNPGSRTRQTRVQRSSTSTSRSLPLSRNVRARLRQRLSHRQRGRYIAAPRLSQAARGLLSSTSSELNQAPRASEALQNGSARTVPQQRRLNERINEMRNNWARIQNGDLQFDTLRVRGTGPIQPAVLSNSNGAALRTGATGPVQPAVSSNSSVAPIPPTPSFRSSVNDKRHVDSVELPESSTQGNKDLQRAWQMMGHAQNLSAGIGSSKSQQPKLGAASSSSALVRARQPTSSATSNLPFARKNLEIPTCSVASPVLENGNAGLYEPGSTPVQMFSNLKHDEIPLRQVPASLALTSVSGECRKEEYPCSSNSKQTLAACTSPIGFDKDSCRPAGGKHTVSLQGFKPELSKSGRHFERKDAGVTQSLTENTRTKDSQDVSAVRENIVARSSSSPSHEGLKVHLTELVKRQTWPVYLAERLDKEQFKQIARAAVHSLLALYDPNKSMSLTCVHFEDQGNDPVIKCCNKCLDKQVEKAVKNAKDKIIPS